MVYSWKAMFFLAILLIIISNQDIHVNAQSLQSPLKQLESGIKIQDIKCKEALVLVIKASNNHPSCVRPTSEQRFLAHGWITPDKFQSVNLYPLTKVHNDTVNPVAVINVRNLNQTLPQNSSGKIQIIPEPYPPNTVELNHTYWKYPSSPAPVQGVEIQGASNGTNANANSNTINLVTQNATIPIPAIITPTQQNMVKIISVGLSPYPLKVGDKPMLNATFQNISDKIFYISGGCRATSLFFTIDPASSVQEKLRPPLMCADWAKEVQPNETFGWVAHSKSINGYYQIVEPNLLTITLYQYVTDQKTGWDLVETIQFNVTATQ